MEIFKVTCSIAPGIICMCLRDIIHVADVNVHFGRRTKRIQNEACDVFIFNCAGGFRQVKQMCMILKLSLCPFTLFYPHL